MGMLQAKQDEGGTKAAIDFATNTLTASPGEMGGMGQLTLSWEPHPDSKRFMLTHST